MLVLFALDKNYKISDLYISNPRSHGIEGRHLPALLGYLEVYPFPLIHWIINQARNSTSLSVIIIHSALAILKMICHPYRWLDFQRVWNLLVQLHIRKFH